MFFMLRREKNCSKFKYKSHMCSMTIHGCCSVLRYLSVTIVTLYPVRHDRYMIVKVHSYVKVVLLIPSTVL